MATSGELKAGNISRTTGGVLPTAGGADDATAADKSRWVLVWSDEFEGKDGTSPDESKWVRETGGGGWGNNELQTYTDRPVNAQQKNGKLVITARKERFAAADGREREYTSARLKTAGRFQRTYGRFEARIRVPRGQGIWPAFWMLGADIGQAGWPACGEIDIMENIGREPEKAYGTLHGPGYSGAQGVGAAYTVRGRLADHFRVFAVEWEPAEIRWYVDGKLYQTRTPRHLPAGAKWVFDHDFFLLLNVAVGGNWPGPPDASTRFPQSMEVDYVRVWARR